MKKTFSTALFSLIMLCASAKVHAVLDFAVFKHPTEGPYVEIYLSINGASLVYDSLAADQYQANVQVGYLIKKRNSNSAVNFSKFELKSPIYKPSDLTEDLVDIKRLSVPNGDYELEIILDDVNSPDSATSVKAPISVQFSSDSLQFSQIQLASALSPSPEESDFSKHGIVIQPNPSAFYNINMQQLAFYLELYNTPEIFVEDMFLIEFKVLKAEDGSIAENIRAFSRKNPAPIIPIVESISIKDLPSGNYQLLVEARDRENKLMASSSKFFQRNNPIYTEEVISDIKQTFVAQYTDAQELQEYIKALEPVSSINELDFAKYRLANGELEQMQKFFYNFWHKRNPTDPAAAWDEYRRRLMYVTENYGSHIQKGYETDPGVIYLKYGKPTTVTKSRFEPGAYPYEIWQYNKIESRSNAKFVFYNRTGQMGDDELLHSNVQGEVSNYRWKAMIYGRNEQFKGTDDVEPRDTYGKDVDDFFRNPR